MANIITTRTFVAVADLPATCDENNQFGYKKFRCSAPDVWIMPTKARGLQHTQNTEFYTTAWCVYEPTLPAIGTFYSIQQIVYETKDTPTYHSNNCQRVRVRVRAGAAGRRYVFRCHGTWGPNQSRSPGTGFSPSKRFVGEDQSNHGGKHVFFCQHLDTTLDDHPTNRPLEDVVPATNGNFSQIIKTKSQRRSGPLAQPSGWTTKGCSGTADLAVNRTNTEVRIQQLGLPHDFPKLCREC